MTALNKAMAKLNGIELRDLIEEAAKITRGSVSISGPVSADYEKYQIKNRPDTIDSALTVIMGAPFPPPLHQTLKNVAAILERIFEPYDVVLWRYAENHIHATVSPIVRTSFDHDAYLRDPDSVSQAQAHEIQRLHPDVDELKTEASRTRSFRITVNPWKIMIGRRGEILLWGCAESAADKEQLTQLRLRLRRSAGDSARDRGPKVHMALATIGAFHVLTGIQKTEIAQNIDQELQSLPAPPSVIIDEVKLVHYLHRSLSRIVQSTTIPFDRVSHKSGRGMQQ